MTAAPHRLPPDEHDDERGSGLETAHALPAPAGTALADVELLIADRFRRP